MRVHATGGLDDEHEVFSFWGLGILFFGSKAEKKFYSQLSSSGSGAFRENPEGLY